jgi:hypothetical protein
MTTKAEYYRGVTGEISVSVREARIVVERFLTVAGLPMGAVAPIRDVVVDAEILGLRALEHLDREFGELAAFHPVRWTDEGAGHVCIDGGDMPALVVAPDVLDLVVAAARRTGAAVADVRDVVEPRFLAALTASAYLYGIQLGVHLPSGESWIARGRTQEPLRALATPGQAPPAGGATRLVCTALSGGAGERVESATTLRALRDGFMVDAELWWSLWDRANRALAPDSLVSRTHAGASVYDDSGQVLGELGEEWDDGYVPPSAGDGEAEVSTIARTRRPKDAPS